MSLKHEIFVGVMRERVEAARAQTLLQKADKLYAAGFEEQQWLFDDLHRFKALLCPRRAGKSYALALYLLITCLRIPRANCVFIAQTRDRAKEILWEIIKVLNAKYEIGIRFSEVYLSGRLPNGSRFRLSGCETKADIEKYRGEAYHLVEIDECASHSSELLRQLLERAIEPALADYRGTLVLAGTPGHILAGPFYETTGEPAFVVENGECTSRPFVERDEPKWKKIRWHWSLHGWSKKENKAIPHLWEEAEARRQRNKWTEQHPVFVREDLGRWIADDSTLCYRFNVTKNTWEPTFGGFLRAKSLPKGHEWRAVLGCDLGSGRTDRFALEVVCYSDSHKDMYHVYEFVAEGIMSVSDMAAEIQRVVLGLVELGIEVESMVGDLDHLGDSIQKQWRDEFGLVVEKAEKKNKRDYIELLNGDLQEFRCFVLKGSVLAYQMTILAWDDTGIKEKSGQRNDAADAFVYTWRKCRHRFFETKASIPLKGSTEWWDKREAEEIEKLEDWEVRRANPGVIFEEDLSDPEDDGKWI